MNSYNLTTNLLQGLGKSTRRGIKKCSKCGVFNGTRGSFCKNKQCGASLKASEDHLRAFDAVKLITGTVRQVYSVQVKDMGSECRGFVQLPLLCNEDNGSMLSDVALCFVDSCQRSFDNSILKCHEEEQSNVEPEKCSHINLALKSQSVAKPISFNLNVLNQMKIPDEMKEKLKLLASDDSPLVQRVSKDTMAVKCQVTPKQPLGYLHFTFTKGRNKGYEKYSCNCTEYITFASCEKAANIKYKCIHYFACIAALSSNQGYLEEFSHFINNEVISSNKTNSSSSRKVTKQIEPLQLKRKKINIISNKLIRKPNLLKKDIPRDLPRSTLKKQKYIIKRCKKIVPKIYPIEIKVLNEPSLTKNDDNDVIWPFLAWLAFVTESINKTMQFINCGIINTQVFYIPEFFATFKERIPKAYLEQKTDMGSVYYSIMNVNHVKEIFDTPKVKLRIAKKFVHHIQEGYIEYEESSENEEMNSTQFHSSFIFFLNVGQSTVDESYNYNNAFIVEWLPNICTTTKVGQLKLQYKYGRKSI